MTHSSNFVEKILYPIALIILGISGGGLVYYTTYWGVGFIDWDSFNYIAVARSIAEGRGLVYPLEPGSYTRLTNFPPMYAITLALFEMVNIDAVQAARHLNALLFTASAILTGITIRRETLSWSFSLLGSVLFIISSALIFYHSFALAEGLYIFLTLLGFLLLVIYVDKGRWYHLLLTSTFLSLTILTRYVGIANILTALFILVLYRKKSLWHTLSTLVSVLLISLGPFLLWVAKNNLAEPSASGSPGPAGIQQLGWQFAGPEHFFSMFLTIYHTIYKYFLPEKIVVGWENGHFILTLSVFIAAFILLFNYGRKNHGDSLYTFKRVYKQYPTFILYISYAIIYLAIVFIVSMFGKPVFVNRILLPNYLSALFVLVISLFLIWELDNIFVHILTIIISVYLVAFSIFQSFHAIPRYHEQGLGLGRKSFHNAESIKLLQKLPENTTIYTNYPWALYLHTKEISFRINDFSPSKLYGGNVWIVLYDYESIRSPEFVRKYAPFLDLLASDGHVQVYSFRASDSD